MKKFIWFLLCVVILLSFDRVSAQTITRKANVPKFFINGIEPFDRWKGVESWGLLGTDSFRYINLFPQDSILGLNSEWRGIWDVPTDEYDGVMLPAPDSITTGGQSEPLLDVIMLSPHVFVGSLANARILRFETERHKQLNDTQEYCGFFNDSSRHALVGRNISDANASFPKFLSGTSRNSETSFSALELVHGRDAAGVFEDSLWNKNFLEPTSPQNLWIQHVYSGVGEYGRNLIVRFRVKVDSLITDSNSHPPLFSVLIKQGNTPVTVLDDTVRIDSQFKNMNTGYDLISLRFRSRLYDDTPTQITLYWHDSVSMRMDYMEVLTARLDDSDYSSSISTYERGYGITHSYSYEELTENNDSLLKTFIHNLKTSFMGKIQYIMVREEFPMSNHQIFRRAAKLLRDSTGGQMELMTSVHDSTDAQISGSFFGTGLPSQFNSLNEGVHKGWFDSSLYADPKIFIIGETPWKYGIPLPRRDTTTGSAYHLWEVTHVPIRGDCDSLNNADAYTRKFYLDSVQSVVRSLLEKYRGAERVCLHNDTLGQRFAVFIEGGTTVLLDNACGDTIVRGSYRGQTAPELKLQCNLPVSCGAAGVILYELVQAPSAVYDGGIMDEFGGHSEELHTFTIRDSDSAHVTIRSRSLFTGWKEDFDTAKTLFPRIIKYGQTLIHSKYIGDWTAAELHNYPSRAALPFFDTIATLDDSLRKDVFKINNSSNNSIDTANKTFAHISMWLDTTSVAIASFSDTLLYITNLRTDDSYDSTKVASTIDRRLITMRMKSPHVILDVLDTNGGQLDSGKIWTPFVRADAPEDSLKIQLLAGDGILIRLLPPDTTGMHQMRAMINYPKGTSDFNDHGRIQFDRAVPGVLDKSNANKWTIPSTSKPYIVGVPDTTTAKMWQDSLLYRSFHQSRPEKWRNQNWTDGTTPKFRFKDSLSQSSTSRQPQISIDSIAHQVVVRTDLEGISSNGKIKFRDPFLVDSATLINVYDTLPKSSPFLPQTLSSGRMPGADSEHYGGIFFKQNDSHLSGKPIYSLNAYNILKSGSFQGQDTGSATAGDWVFMHWVSNDDVDGDDTQPWDENAMDYNGYDYPYIKMNKSSEVVFVRDSAQYHARYKAHMAAFSNTSDPGFAMNNQRKLFYLYTDASLKRWYRIIYSSAGRIYTSLGFRTGSGNSDIHWNNEELLSEWDNPIAEYPAIGLHKDTLTVDDTTFHYVYQTTEDSTFSDIKIGSIVNGIPTIHDDLDQDPFGTTQDGGTAEATPVIATVEGTTNKLDVAAWASPLGIVVKGIGALGTLSEVRTDGGRNGGPEFRFGDSTAKHPTIWVDTCFVCMNDSSVHLVTLAWQQDTLIHNLHGTRHKPNNDSTFTDIFVVQFDIRYGKRDSLAPYIYFRPHSGMTLSPIDLSYLIKPLGWDNRNPCISGARYASDTSLQRIAYETKAYNGFMEQGISVAHLRTGKGWKMTKFFATSDTVADLYWKPSIEVSRYRNAGVGVNIKGNNYYSLAFERNNGTHTQHWSFDSVTTRGTATTFSNTRLPQLAVVKESIDSDTYRMGLGLGLSPNLMSSGYTGLYKVGGNDTLWSYHAITETDSSNSIYIEHAIGEPAIDDGLTKTELEMVERPEDEIVDDNHPAEYFAQTENFTLPVSGTFNYFLWIKNTGDDYYKSKFDTIKYALDFFDTSGSFVCRLDSVIICDSIPHINDTVHSVTVSRENTSFGYARFRRITPALSTTGSEWEPIITQKRLSSVASYKRKGNSNSDSPNDILFTAEPNPSRGDVKLTFDIPGDGEVTIEAYNQLGVKVSDISKNRTFRGGEHEAIWHPNSLPSGSYYMTLHYGNSEKVIRVIYIQ